MFRSRPAPELPAAITAPTHCPECRSTDLITASKTVSDASYWRCVQCGEVWNVGRTDRARRTYRRPY